MSVQTLKGNRILCLLPENALRVSSLLLFLFVMIIFPSLQHHLCLVRVFIYYYFVGVLLIRSTGLATFGAELAENLSRRTYTLAAGSSR